MSLTSYRAAPSRDRINLISFMRGFAYLTRFGGDLLSHTLRCSTIGATALNCRDRDGIGCFARAMTTKPRKRRDTGAVWCAVFRQARVSHIRQSLCFNNIRCCRGGMGPCWPISHADNECSKSMLHLLTQDTAVLLTFF